MFLGSGNISILPPPPGSGMRNLIPSPSNPSVSHAVTQPLPQPQFQKSATSRESDWGDFNSFSSTRYICFLYFYSISKRHLELTVIIQ